MNSSRGRNSILDWLIAATLAAAVISGLAGIDADLGALRIRSHGPWRLLLAAAVLLGVRWRLSTTLKAAPSAVEGRLGIAPAPAFIARIAMLTAICGSVATWFRFLLTTIGGADSYGYVSAATLIAHGRLIADAPIAEWLSIANRVAVASPLGWTPSPDGTGIAPAYPIGAPVVMALFSLAGGPSAVFFVAPAAGLAILLLVYRTARAWYDAETALLAVALTAWSPLVIAYAKQPMSDALAAMWVMLALSLALRSSTITAAGAGLAAGAAVITRPALLIAAVVLLFIRLKPDTRVESAQVESAFRRIDKHPAIAFSSALLICVAIQMAIQQHLFGSPLSTGYGATGALFSINHVITNAGIFAKHLWTTGGPLWVIGLVLGIFAARPEPRRWPLVLLAAVALPYFFYLPFDHWETLRYLLPGLVPVSILVADGLMRLARWPRHEIATAALTITLITATAAWSENLLRRSEVWNVTALEARYPLAGEWINVNTPPNSVVLANQHSGSLRWYGKRQTLRWDFIAPEDLARTVSDLESHGATVYVALEGKEVEMFESRFAGVIDRLRVDHVGHIRDVHFRRVAVHGR